MDEQRARAPSSPARRAWRSDVVQANSRAKLGPTNFVGYEATVDARTTCSDDRAWQARRRLGGFSIEIVADQTPFYGESGGQVGDTGIIDRRGLRASKSTDTLKTPTGLIVHDGKIADGDVEHVGVDVNSHRRRRAPRRDPRQSLGHAPAPPRAQEVLGDARGAEGLAGGARSAALRLRALLADDATRRSGASRISSTSEIRATRDEQVEVMAFDEAKQLGRRRAVRREVRRHACA